MFHNKKEGKNLPSYFFMFFKKLTFEAYIF